MLLTSVVFKECKANGEIKDFSCEVFRMVMLGIYEMTMTYENHQQMLAESIELLLGCDVDYAHDFCLTKYR